MLLRNFCLACVSFAIFMIRAVSFKTGFCPNKPGSLDLRYDPEVSSERPTASEVLQNISDRDLTRLLKSYSGLSASKARYAANAIIEARYMFHKFKTTQELYEVMRTAAKTYSIENQSKVSSFNSIHHIYEGMDTLPR